MLLTKVLISSSVVIIDVSETTLRISLSHLIVRDYFLGEILRFDHFSTIEIGIMGEKSNSKV